MEIWKKIEGFEKYSVSNKGRIRNDKTGRIGKSGRTGYQEFRPMKNKVRYKLYVHRLVAQAFIPNPENYKYVNHIDENPENNCVENLEWCTQSHNIKHGTSIERMMKSRTNNNGKNKPRGVYVDDVFFRSLLMASRHMKCCHSTIRYKLDAGETEYKGYKIRWA